MTRLLRRLVGGLFVVLVLLYLYLPAFVVVPLALSESAFLQFPPPGYSFEWYRQFLADPAWTAAIVRSVKVACGAAVFAIVLGGLAAYYMTRRRGRLASAVEPLLILPLAVPVIVFALGAYTLAVDYDLVGNTILLMAVHSLLALPFAYVNIRVGLSAIDPRLEMAAQSLGARPSVGVARIVMPLLLPALAAAFVLSFMISLDETVLSLFLAGDSTPTLPVKMFTSLSFDVNPLVPVAATFLLMLTIAAGVLFGLLRWTFRRFVMSAQTRRA